jgi:hypothetical protein
MNQQIAHIFRSAVEEKVKTGQPITKAELSVYLGVAYSVVRGWHWLPMLGGLLFFDDFTLARRMQLGLESDPRIVGHLRKSTAGKSVKRLCSHD